MSEMTVVFQVLYCGVCISAVSVAVPSTVENLVALGGKVEPLKLCVTPEVAAECEEAVKKARGI